MVTGGNRSFDDLQGFRRRNDISGLVKEPDVPSPLGPFTRYIVQEVLNDPASITPEKIQSYRERFGSRFDFLEIAPHNSVIAVPARGPGKLGLQPVILFPFFSHLDLPLKVGEHVWAMFELADNRDLGYWLSRIVAPRHVEDANYTHDDRRWQVGLQPSLKEKAGQAPPADPTPSFRNGLGIPETFSLTQLGPRNAYDVLDEESDAAQAHIREPVPRFRKRPGDAVLEGSHNTLIVLGQDRRSAPVTLDGEGNTVGLPESDQSLSSGAIDIVAGRGTVPATAPLVIENTRGEIETDKNPVATGAGPEVITEGDPNFAHDLSRIFVAMSTLPDRNLGIEGLPNVQDEDDVDDPVPAVITKSDSIRIVARKDIRIIVAPAGVGEDPDDTEFASIVIKRSGDIIFSPSDSGVIRLGGEDADRAILCTDVPVVGGGEAVPGGRVVSAPIETTAAGKVGVGSGNLGTFATKILVRAT